MIIPSSRPTSLRAQIQSIPSSSNSPGPSTSTLPKITIRRPTIFRLSAHFALSFSVLSCRHFAARPGAGNGCRVPAPARCFCLCGRQAGVAGAGACLPIVAYVQKRKSECYGPRAAPGNRCLARSEGAGRTWRNPPNPRALVVHPDSDGSGGRRSADGGSRDGGRVPRRPEYTVSATLRRLWRWQARRVPAWATHTLGRGRPRQR